MTVDRCNYFFFALLSFLPADIFLFSSSLTLSIHQIIFPPFLSQNKTLTLSPSQNFAPLSFNLVFFFLHADISVKALASYAGSCIYRGEDAVIASNAHTHTLQCTTSFIKNKPLILPTPAKAKNSFAALLLLRYLSLLSSCFVDALSSRSWFGRCNNYDNNNNNIHNKTPTRNWFVCYFWLSFLSAFSLE